MKTRVIILLCLCTVFGYAQQKPISIITNKKPVAYCKTPPLKSMIPYTEESIQTVLKEEAHNIEESNLYKTIDQFTDPVRQTEIGNKTAPPLTVNFDGLGPMDETCTNPDTQGDVGLNHYMQMVKRSFAIWDKEGNLLYGPENNKTLWSTLPGPWLDHWFTDPIVIYDHLEDRWLASNMVYEIQTDYLYWEVIAVSATPDPLGEWYCYAFEFDHMPDYPKFGVWNNEYVLTINEFEIYGGSGTYKGGQIWAFNKQDLLNGEPEPGIIAFATDSGNNNIAVEPSSWLPCDLDGLPAEPGTPNYLAYVKDDAWGFDYDHISLWELNTDWENPDNSSFEEVQQLPVDPFTTFNQTWNITQPNTSNKLFSMGDRLMYRLQYRNFGDYEMLTTNHTVTVDENNLTGMRWYELRNYGEGWIIHQQSTFSPDDHHRWMGSISMDNRGNIAAGYSVSSEDVYPSIRMTGRVDTDPAGFMSLEEIEVVTGNGYQALWNHRWGDYSCMSIDPVDDQTFWYTQMYIPITGALEWETKICAVKMAKELNFNTDTLKFETYDECMEGKFLVIKNNSWDEIIINDIEQQGYIQSGIEWQVDEMPVSLPYSLQQGDSINLLITVDFIVNQLYNGFVFDTLTTTANSSYVYNTIIAVNEDFVYQLPEDKASSQTISIFPNPFTNETNISLNLEKTSKVSIEILNQNQSTVSVVLKNKRLKKGQHNYKWNRIDQNQNKAPSGIYYCKVFINGKILIRKIIIK